MKKLIIVLLCAFFMTGCASLRTDNYWVKSGQKWNDHTNGKMKCKNNANPHGKFNK